MMPGRWRLLLLMILSLLAVSDANRVVAQPMQIEVIELYARDADEMVRLLRPMLAPGGTIRGFRDKLVISTTPENLADLRRILDQVDAPPHQLVITVRQMLSSQSLERNLEISGSVGGEHGRVTVPKKSAFAGQQAGAREADHIDVRIDSSRSDVGGGAQQSVRVTEGVPAFIAIGESVPIRVQSGAGNSRGRPVEYHNVVSGFYAVARLRDETVTIQLASKADTVIDHATGAAHIERVTSVLSGRLGEWLEVGGVAHSAQVEGSGTVYHQDSASGDQRRTYIKVEELN
jgi:hypothetical protein